MDNISEGIMEWARTNNFTQPFVITHRLYLKRTFGKNIKKIVCELEARGAGALAGRLEKEFKKLLKKTEEIDSLCRQGCTTEDELNNFEFAEKNVRQKAIEMAELLRTAQQPCNMKNTGDLKFVNVPVIEYKECAPRAKPQSGTGNEYITLTEAANILGISKSTASKWAAKGKIKTNGRCGKEKKLSKISVLLVKQEREDEDIAKDVQDLREDAKRIR